MNALERTWRPSSIKGAMSSYAIRNDYEDEESMRGRLPVWMVVVTGGSGAAPAHRALSARSRDAREQRVQRKRPPLLRAVVQTRVSFPFRLQ